MTICNSAILYELVYEGLKAVVIGNEPPKSRKRGPKPNQRPAKNEKVERNRKAQR